MNYIGISTFMAGMIGTTRRFYAIDLLIRNKNMLIRNSCDNYWGKSRVNTFFYIYARSFIFLGNIWWALLHDTSWIHFRFDLVNKNCFTIYTCVLKSLIIAKTVIKNPFAILNTLYTICWRVWPLTTIPTTVWSTATLFILITPLTLTRTHSTGIWV